MLDQRGASVRTVAREDVENTVRGRHQMVRRYGVGREEGGGGMRKEGGGGREGGREEEKNPGGKPRRVVMAPISRAVRTVSSEGLRTHEQPEARQGAS